MEALYGLLILVGFTILGFILGRVTQKTHGTLVIDLTDPMKDIYRFEADDIAGLAEHKQVVFKVDKRFPPQN